MTGFENGPIEKTKPWVVAARCGWMQKSWRLASTERPRPKRRPWTRLSISLIPLFQREFKDFIILCNCYTSIKHACSGLKNLSMNELPTRDRHDTLGIRQSLSNCLIVHGISHERLAPSCDTFSNFSIKGNPSCVAVLSVKIHLYSTTLIFPTFLQVQKHRLTMLEPFMDRMPYLPVEESHPKHPKTLLAARRKSNGLHLPNDVKVILGGLQH